MLFKWQNGNFPSCQTDFFTSRVNFFQRDMSFLCIRWSRVVNKHYGYKKVLSIQKQCSHYVFKYFEYRNQNLPYVANAQSHIVAMLPDKAFEFAKGRH